MNADTALTLLADDPSAQVDLAEVALLLARDEYLDLDVEAYLGELTALARDLKPRLRGGLQARTRALCRYLFHDLGFRGNTRDYYDPRNSYLNEVLDRRTGLPIALTATAMAVAERAGLPVVGVGLPGHFVAKAVDGAAEVLFDPFHGGRLLTPTDCEGLVKRTTGVDFEATPETLQAVPNGLIVQRMLNNLKAVYLSRNEYEKAVRIIERLRQLCPRDPLQGRDLGAALLQAGKPGQALGPLEQYLQQVPAAEDRADVDRLLDAARAAIARWN
jgi:regulator of sirC expression with transglutaminase-like and TPR domain